MCSNGRYRRCYYRPLIGSRNVIYGLSNSGNSDDLGWPSKSFTYCKLFQMGFFVQLYSSWQDFNWHSASRGPSTIAERLVLCVNVHTWGCHGWNSTSSGDHQVGNWRVNCQHSSLFCITVSWTCFTCCLQCNKGWWWLCDTTWYDIFTCAKKLMKSQLNVAHGGPTYIHTCLSYVHTPCDFTNGALTRSTN